MAVSGQGFSSFDPKKAKGEQISAGEYTKIYKSGGGRSRSPLPPSVSISGDTVFIGGQGYSVAPNLQADFIRQRTSSSNTSAQQAIAQAQRQADLQRKQAEQQRLQDQLRQQREEKAFGGTIAGQLEGSKTNKQQELTVSAYDPNQRYTQTPYRQGFFTSAGMAISNFAKDISPLHRGGMTLQSPERYTDIFQYSEGLKRDETVFTQPQFGTVQTDPITGQPKTGRVTFGDIQKETELKRNLILGTGSSGFDSEASVLVSGVQSKVDKGEIDVLTGQTMVDEGIRDINKRYTEFQEQTYKENPDVPGVFEKTGKARRIANIAPDVLAVGGIVATSAVNPVLGASLGVGYFTGKGVLQASSKPTYKEIGQQGGLFANVEEDEKGRLKILNPTELDVRYKNVRREAGANLLFGAVSGVNLAISSANAITKQTVKEGITAEEYTLGFEKKYLRGTGREGVKLDRFLATETRQSAGTFKRVTTTENPILQSSRGEFTLGVGKGTTKYQYQDFLKQIRGYEDPFIRGGESFVVQAKGSIGNAILGSGKNIVALPQTTKVFRGSGFIGTDKGTKEFLFGGISNQQGNIILSRGGRATSVRAYTSSTPIFNEKGTLLGFDTSISEASIRVPTKGYGITISKNTIMSDVGKESATGFGSFSSGGGKSSKAFFEQLYGQNLKSVSLPGFGSGIAETTKGVITTTKPAPQITGLGSSLFAGTGQYERTGGQLLVSPKSISSPTIIENILLGQSNISSIIPKTKTGGGSRTKTLQTSVQSKITSPIQNLLPRQDLIPRQGVKQKTIQKQVLDQVLVQAPLTTPRIYTPPRIGGFDFGLPPIPKGDFLGRATKRKPQRGRQRTAYQTSLTGSILGIRGTGIIPGGLSVRGLVKKKSKRKKIRII